MANINFRRGAPVASPAVSSRPGGLGSRVLAGVRSPKPPMRGAVPAPSMEPPATLESLEQRIEAIEAKLGIGKEGMEEPGEGGEGMGGEAGAI